MELTSEGKDLASPVVRGASVKTLRPRVWRMSKPQNTATNEDLFPIVMRPCAVEHFVVHSVYPLSWLFLCVS